MPSRRRLQLSAFLGAHLVGIVGAALLAGCSFDTEGSLVDNRTDRSDASTGAGSPPADGAGGGGGGAGGGPGSNACAAGFADCDHDPSNGCEANLGADPSHCGSCTNACPANGGIAVCKGGACGISSCNAGFADCDGDPNDCETDVTTTASCGYCGNACQLANASARCEDGTCRIASCNAGFADCDGNAANGCETNLASDLANCGACGQRCTQPANGESTCIGGQCGVACNKFLLTLLFDDCNRVLDDGCEIDLMNDPQNCGFCGHACPAVPNSGPTCGLGLCGFQCQQGFERCRAGTFESCVNLANDLKNCGKCGRSCASDQVCLAGKCDG